jgi:KipI family sensor histidine kinase inhibitor
MPRAEISVYNSGESAIYCSLGDEISPLVNFRVNAFEKHIRQIGLKGIIETVPSYSGVMIYYNPLLIDHQTLLENINSFNISGSVPSDDKMLQEIIIPVCYGGIYGPDLQFVAEHSSLETDDVIKIHTSSSYLIYMLGFTPGFPYLGGMDRRLSTPRKDEPSLSVPAGSVGIAGDQTGIYPVTSPGGWQIIGRTPLRLFNPALESPFLLEPGMHITFRSVSEDKFRMITESIEDGSYMPEKENRKG